MSKRKVYHNLLDYLLFPLISNNNIYKRNCKTCNFIYIGETSQYQQCGDQGHKDAIKACPNHEINWDDVSYLDKDNNTGRRLIKEALYINAFDEGNLMNLTNSYAEKI